MPTIVRALCLLVGLLTTGCTLWQSYPDPAPAPNFTAAGDEPGHPLPGRAGLQASRSPGMATDADAAAALSLIGGESLPTMPRLHASSADRPQEANGPERRPASSQARPESPAAVERTREQGPRTVAAPRAAVTSAPLSDNTGANADQESGDEGSGDAEGSGDNAAAAAAGSDEVPPSAHSVIALQLAPYRQEADARQGWAAITARVPELRQLRPMLRAMVLGDAGMFHRLFAVGLDQAGFRQLCERIRDRMPSCTIVAVPLD